MSVSKWKYTEACDGDYCVGDCDLCNKEPESEQFSTEHIAKAVEKLNERPEQSVADDLKAYFTQMLQNADFVRVVRCKNCKYYKSYCEKYKSFCAYHITEYDKHNGECSYNGLEVTESFYCADGERKEIE